mmetsp:Transcript_30450/g.48876  ORF Transcript_30450/g.48876 Transcript_30450/m.48876 type:complete len:119 (-) Transcript_30450:161-517(-)
MLHYAPCALLDAIGLWDMKYNWKESCEVFVTVDQEHALSKKHPVVNPGQQRHKIEGSIHQINVTAIRMQCLSPCVSTDQRVNDASVCMLLKKNRCDEAFCRCVGLCVAGTAAVVHWCT